MNFIITPTALIYLAIIALEYSFAFSYSSFMLTFVLVVAQVVGTAQSFTATFIKHTLVAETILKEHCSYTMKLTIINLAIVDIVLMPTFVSFNSFNYS